MIRERNDTGADTENHSRMNFTMRVGVLGLLSEVVKVHGNHTTLFLLDIQEFNKSFLAEGLELPSDFLVQLFVEHHLNMPFSDFNLVIVHDVERTLAAPSVGEEADLLPSEVTHDGDLTLDSVVSA
jgi:hypothetical protein